MRDEVTASSQFHRLALPGILILYLALATAMSLTKIPICDEGWYADPAQNLIKNGNMGSPVIESAGGFLKGIERYTYWEMPLHIVLQAGWYQLFGASLFSMRALSVLAGLAALVGWYVVTLNASNQRSIALLATLLTAVDTTFLGLAATGRTDMLSVAFGAAAQASYLTLRASQFKMALLISHSFAVASGLTHPIGGLVTFASIVFLQLFLDRRRFSIWRLLLLVATPYVIGALGWGIYILKSPDSFLAQFGGNSSERLWPFKAPLLALKREVVDRFIGGYRTGSSSWSPLANLRLLILAGYLAGLLTMAFRSHLRRSPLAAIVLGQTGLTFVILLFFEGAKQPWFLIHLARLFAVALAVSLIGLWDRSASWRPILAIGAVGFICIELGYPALLVAQNRYRSNYVPLVALLRDRATEPRSVMGAAELGFGLGFERVLDDSHLGYYTRKEPKFIVFDPRYRAMLEQFRRERPEIYDYIQRLLSSHYHQLYSNGYYTAWAQVGQTDSLPAELNQKSNE